MPPRGTSKKECRECLVCGAETSTAHMGVDVCRACTVFYRRSRGKKAFVCRSSTKQCRAGPGLNCRKCRFLLLEQILEQSGARDKAVEDPSFVRASKRNNGHAEASGSSLPPTLPQHDRPLLAAVRAAYEKMCFGRLMGELYMRQDPPKTFDATNHPVYPATFRTMNLANQMLLPCIREFASSAFPEFRSFSDELKHKLATKFYYSFRPFDGGYRAKRHFANDLNRCFAAYTLWMSEEIVENFFDDDDDARRGNVAEAKIFLLKMIRARPHASRDPIERVQPDDEEFLAVLALMFWKTNGICPGAEPIAIAADKYRQQIYSELSSYYRNELHLKDYSARMGEICMFVPMFEIEDAVKESYGVLRLLDIYKDDSFTYTLVNA